MQKKKNLKISIITPCLNSEKTIRDTFESVLNQKYSNIEYIVIDGGSTDNTLKLIQEYMILFQGKMRYISEPDLGIYYAMNKGIQMATGEIIGIINSDDYYELNTVEEVVNNRTASKYQVIYGVLRIIEKNGLIIYGSAKEKSLSKWMIQHPTCFVTKATYERYGYFDLKYKYAADYEFMQRCKKNGVEFTFCYKILANFRGGGASVSRRTEIETQRIRFKYGQIGFWDIFFNELLYILRI